MIQKYIYYNQALFVKYLKQLSIQEQKRYLDMINIH